MAAWAWLLAVAAVLGVAAALYGPDRLGLWLEDRGWLYYRRKKPESSPAGCLVALHQLVEPGAKHAVQLKHGEQGRASRVRLLAELVDCLAEAAVDAGQVRRLLGVARRAGLDWRELYAEAVQVRGTSRSDLPVLPPPPDDLEPLT